MDGHCEYLLWSWYYLDLFPSATSISYMLSRSINVFLENKFKSLGIRYVSSLILGNWIIIFLSLVDQPPWQRQDEKRRVVMAYASLITNNDSSFTSIIQWSLIFSSLRIFFHFWACWLRGVFEDLTRLAWIYGEITCNWLKKTSAA